MKVYYCLDCDKYFPNNTNHKHDLYEFSCDKKPAKDGTRPFTLLRTMYLLRRHITLLHTIAMKQREELFSWECGHDPWENEHGEV